MSDEVKKKAGNGSGPVDREDIGGSPGRRQANGRGQGARLRTELLDAADCLVEARGDAGALSLRAVAEQAGVATTSIYLHFSDLRQLKLALAQRGFLDFAAVRDRSCAGIQDPVRALTARCQAYGTYASEHPGRYRLMFGPDLEDLGSDTTADTPSRAALRGLEASITECLATRAISADIDPVRSAVLLWTALHGQAALRMDRPHFPWPPPHELVTELLHRLLGIRPTSDVRRAGI